MFYGEYRHTLDVKGRLTIPSRYRDQFASGVLITQGLDGCLYVYPLERWEEFSDNLDDRLDDMGEMGRVVKRFFYSKAFDTNVDKQGRVLIPPRLREHAGIETEVVVSGARQRMELWSPERWEQIDSEAAGNIELITEQFSHKPG